MLIVAVHDVAASTLDEVRWLLGRLDDAGVPRRVLKVIPGEPATPDRVADLRALLAEEAAAGSEIVLHGWTHRADGRPRGGAWDRLRTRLFAGDAAEFMAIDAAEMGRRIACGRQWLAEIGLGAQGFCPPGWLAAPGLATAARAEGFRYLVLLRGLRDLRDGRWLVLPPRGYMGTGAVQERLVGVGGTVLSRPLIAALRSPAQRIFLHPQGASRARACATTLAEVGRLARRHPVTTYSALLQ